MEDPRWLSDWPGRAHAFYPGSTRSLCGQVDLPVSFTDDPDIARCRNCQRMVVQRMAAKQASAAPVTERWREIAVRAVLGDSWSYAETQNMPSFRESVDRVTVALADAYQQGILQGSSSGRTEK
jgi:hypothetical protein